MNLKVFSDQTLQGYYTRIVLFKSGYPNTLTVDISYCYSYSEEIHLSNRGTYLDYYVY